PGFESDRYRIKLYDRASGKTRTLTEAWDRSPESIRWTSDGKSLLVTAAEAARQKIFQVTLATGEPKELIKDHYNSGVAIASQTALVFSQDSLTAPAELWTAR